MSQKLNVHSLVVIPPSDWNILLELYKERKTEALGYNLINSYIKLIEKEPEFNAKFLSLDGDWKNDGTFILIINQKRAFCNTLSSNLDRLKTALLCLSPKFEDYKPCVYNDRIAPAAVAYLNLFDRAQCTIKIAWYIATKELVQTFSVEPPPGITLRKLDIKDAPLINELWPHKFEGSVELVKKLIVCDVSAGACDADGNLIAWCMRNNGALGLLQVVESHKRLGLGSLMVRCVSKKISQLDEEVLAPVVNENTASRKVFEKLGFQIIDYIHWSE